MGWLFRSKQLRYESDGFGDRGAGIFALTTPHNLAKSPPRIFHPPNYDMESPSPSPLAPPHHQRSRHWISGCAASDEEWLPAKRRRRDSADLWRNTGKYVGSARFVLPSLAAAAAPAARG